MTEPAGSLPRLVYGAVNEAVLRAVPLEARRILDLGCGDGALGAALKARQPCKVTGVTSSEEEAVPARKALDRVVVADLDVWDPQGTDHDLCIASHVLEHLVRPGELLSRLRNATRTRADFRLVVALPNVLFYRERWRLLRGSFRYTRGGILDDTHVRFFDWKTAQELVTGSGFELVSATADGIFPQPILRWLGSRGLASLLDRAASRSWPGLFGHQFVITAK